MSAPSTLMRYPLGLCCVYQPVSPPWAYLHGRSLAGYPLFMGHAKFLEDTLLIFLSLFRSQPLDLIIEALLAAHVCL